MHGVDWVTLGWGIWGTKNVTFNAKRPAHKIIKVSSLRSFVTIPNVRKRRRNEVGLLPVLRDCGDSAQDIAYGV